MALSEADDQETVAVPDDHHAHRRSNSASTSTSSLAKPDVEHLGEAATPVKCTIHFNRLLTPFNKWEAYPVFTARLQGVEQYFKDPNPPPSNPTPPSKPSKAKHVFERLFRCHKPSTHPLATLPPLLVQHTNPKPAQIKQLFSHTPHGAVARAAVRKAHRALFGHGVFGRFKRKTVARLASGDEFCDFLQHHGGEIKTFETDEQEQSTKDRRKHYASRRSQEFTFTLLGPSKPGHRAILHFSPASTPIQGLASKHAIHSKCAPFVVYSGTFRLEERGGQVWVVMDNDSGTYAPRVDRGELDRLKSLMEWNFKGMRCETREFVPPELDGEEDQAKGNENDDDDGPESEGQGKEANRV
ncbi:hypothetical protein HDU85_001539 [Gaertneriomyces sp. JEL0708]|nr:hypothetical protein HDU85_001539 [Gaertneriomyces sp. JEL0708]